MIAELWTRHIPYRWYCHICIYMFTYIYIYQKPDFCMYVCLFYMVIYVSRLGGCVRRSFYRDILFPYSLPYTELCVHVYPKQNSVMPCFPQNSVMSCFPNDETNLTNYLARPDNNNIHSHQSESVLSLLLILSNIAR